MDDRTSPSTATLAAIASQPQPPKFSRYRSVRRSAATNATNNGLTPAQQSYPHPPLPSATIPGVDSSSRVQNAAIQRSMSRYRHAKSGATAKLDNSVPVPRPTSASIDTIEPLSSDIVASDRPLSPPHSTNTDARKIHSPNDGNTSPADAYDAHGYRTNLWQSDNRGVSEVSAAVVENTTTQSPEWKLRRQLRREAANGREVAGSDPSPLSSPSSKSRGTDRTASMKRDTTYERLENEKATAKHNSAPEKRERGRGQSMKETTGGLLALMKGHDSKSTSRFKGGERATLKKKISSPKPIDPMDIGATDAIVDNRPINDAPISAVNAGERKVLVVYGSSSVSLPVTPTTRAQDLLDAAAKSLSDHQIVPRSHMLLESFKQLGLERPLRRYEHVRDLMNSWDNDSQNYLLVVPCPAGDGGGQDDVLDAKFAPTHQPPASSFYIYHSQRPGKWDKRVITLKADGQVTVSKKQAKGSESTNICHLSDFDIYTLSRTKSAKSVNAPKKLCYAVKSQQKSSMFISTENFIHFFATNEQSVAADFYKAIQQWRSWYLFNVLGEGSTKQPKEEKSIKRSLKSMGKVAMVGSSTDSLRLEEANPSVDYHSSVNLRSRGHTLEREEPLVSRAKSKSTPAAAPLAQAEPEGKIQQEPTFSPTGLLGNNYGLRLNALREREREMDNGPFSNSPGTFLNRLDTEGLFQSCPNSWRLSLDIGHLGAKVAPNLPGGSFGNQDTDATSLRTSKSTRSRPKPLVDLTPVYQEAPQHVSRGRGVAVGAGMPLVDAATSPELAPGAIVVPSATTWWRPSRRGGAISSSNCSEKSGETMTAAQQQQRRPRSNTTRSTALRYSSGDYNSNNNSTSNSNRSSRTMGASGGGEGWMSSPDEMSPFSPTGLVSLSSRLQKSQGASRTGRGVATGDRNAIGRPMLDLSEPSRFSEGSLLRSVEARAAD